MHGNNEEPWSRVRQKPYSVHDERTNPIALLHQSVNDRGEITPVVRRESADYVLQDDDLRNPPKSNHASHEFPKWVKRSAAITIESSTIPRKRQVLTRKRTPNQCGIARKVLWLEPRHVLHPQFGIAKIRPV
jgi:hypothetical protein